MSERAETIACVKALKELLEAVENAEWTNPDLASWEFEEMLHDAKTRAKDAIALFDFKAETP